jgi:hypothetical protein
VVSFTPLLLSLSLSVYGSTALWTLAAFSVSYSHTQSVGLLGRGISPSQVRYLHMTTQTQNKRVQTSMPRVVFEPTIPVFKWTKTVHALDRAATVIGPCHFTPGKRAAGTHWTGGAWAPGSVCTLWRRKNLVLSVIESGPAGRYPVAIPTEISRLVVNYILIMKYVTH